MRESHSISDIPDLSEYFGQLASFQLKNVHLFSLKDVQGRAFDIRIACPVEHPAQVVIVLDHDFIGDTAIETARNMMLGLELEDTAIVTVSFGAETFGALHALRCKYYSFEDIDLSFLGARATGGGTGFLAFLTDMLIPELAERYPDIKIPPALVGYSMSGLFVLGAIARADDAFSGYAVISPALWIDNGMTGDRLAARKLSAPVRLQAFAGSLEEGDDDLSRFTQMVTRPAQLCGALAVHPDWDCHFSTLENESHQSVVAPAIARALRTGIGKQN